MEHNSKSPFKICKFVNQQYRFLVDWISPSIQDDSFAWFDKWTWKRLHSLKTRVGQANRINHGLLAWDISILLKKLIEAEVELFILQNVSAST